jgi:hypothetical protein
MNEDDITGTIEHRGAKQNYVADWDADTRDDLVYLHPNNFQTSKIAGIKKISGKTYEETALWRLGEIVRSIEAGI